jgi:hypothetical protein
MAIKSLYSVISGPAGQKRDIRKLKTCFIRKSATALLLRRRNQIRLN